MFCEIFLGFAGTEDKVKSFALIRVYNLENENSIQVGGVVKVWYHSKLFLFYLVVTLKIFHSGVARLI